MSFEKKLLIIKALKYEQKSGIIHWKAAQKCSILRPFAWIYDLGRHVGAFMRKGLYKSFSSDLKTSKQQQELLDELKDKV